MGAIKRFRVDPRVSLDDVQLLTMIMAGGIEPGLVAEARDVGDQR